MRRIVLFFVFFLFIFLAAAQNVSAANCTIGVPGVSPPPFLVGTSKISITITSNKSLNPNPGIFDVYVAGSAIQHTGREPAYLGFFRQQFDGNGNYNFSADISRGGFQAGSFNVYVLPQGTTFTSSSDALCSSGSFNVSPVTAGESCTISVSSSVDSSNNNAYFDTADTITVKATNYIGEYAADGGQHKLHITNLDTGKDYTDPNIPDCPTIAALRNGVSIGTLPEGNYTVRLESACVSGDHGCDLNTPFPITPTGTTDTKPVTSQTQECWVCPVNSSNFNNSTTPPTCTDTSNNNLVPARSAGFCSGNTPVCDLSHEFGCETANGLPSNPTAAPTNPPFCDQSGSGSNIIYTCHTALGDIIASPQGFITRLFGIILSISGGIALLLIIISGYKILSSQGNPEALKGAREQLTAAIVGLLFIIFALVILEIIGVNILHIPGLGGSPLPQPPNAHLGGA